MTAKGPQAAIPATPAVTERPLINPRFRDFGRLQGDTGRARSDELAKRRSRMSVVAGVILPKSAV
jgi:hypothetical protein